MLEKPSGTIAICGEIGLLERKVYNTLLLRARESLKNKNSEFAIELPEMLKILCLEKDKIIPIIKNFK